MDYVSTVTGLLKIADLNLELQYMEIIDLTTDDFKISPQIRECLRNNQLELYVQNRHPNARRLKIREKKEKARTSDSDKSLQQLLFLIEKNLSKFDQSDKLEKVIASLAQNNTPFDSSPLLEKLDKVISIISENNSKWDILFSKLDKLSSNNFSMSNNISYRENSQRVSDEPVYVPKIDLGSFSQKSVKTEQLNSTGTEDILDQLKRLKGGG